MNWFYAKNGAQEGPVSTESLQAKIQSGEVSPGDLAWREGMADWLPVSRIPEFSAAPVAASLEPTSPYVTPTAAPSPVPAAYQQGPVIMAPVSSGLAIASLVCGILSLVCCLVWYLSGILALVAVVLGHIAVSKAKKEPARFGGTGMARGGLATGYIGLILALIMVAFAVFAMTMTPEKMEKLIDSMPVPAEQKQKMKEDFRRAQEAKGGTHIQSPDTDTTPAEPEKP